MLDKEQEDAPLSERVVKEAVGIGMETPLREPILEAVQESEGGPSARGRGLPLAGGLFGLGAAVGYLAGRESTMSDESLLERAETITESIDDVEDLDLETDVTSDDEPEVDVDMDTESETGSRLPRIALVVAILAGLAVLRQRLKSEEQEEWEPIEEFEPAIVEDEDESEEVTESEEGEEAEAEMDTDDEDETEEE